MSSFLQNIDYPHLAIRTVKHREFGVARLIEVTGICFCDRKEDHKRLTVIETNEELYNEAD